MTLKPEKTVRDFFGRPGIKTGNGVRKKPEHCRPKRRTPEQEKELCGLYIAGATLQDIATELGVSRERIRQILARNGVRREHTHRHGLRTIRQVPAEHRGDRIHETAWRRNAPQRADMVDVVRALALGLGRPPIRREVLEAVGWKSKDNIKLCALWADRRGGIGITGRGQCQKAWAALYGEAGVPIPPKMSGKTDRYDWKRMVERHRAWWAGKSPEDKRAHGQKIQAAKRAKQLQRDYDWSV
jgi:hypothetical protein